MSEARAEVASIIDSNQKLLEKLVDDKIDKPAPVVVPGDASKRMEPIQTRRPQWGKIRSDYEAKQRQKYWQDKIDEVEAADARQAQSAEKAPPIQAEGKV